MDTLGLTEQPYPKLSSDEMLELERIYKDMGEKPLDRKLCQEIAKRFSSLSNAAGKTPLSWLQVEQWFKDRQRVSQNKDSSSSSLLPLSADLSSSKGTQATDISDLAFEARSTKDIAWHDIALFLNYRVLCTGELEVRVRYAGFGKEQDEWVNVKQGVRERSVPLAPSECHRVQDGNLVLCFLERDDYALYCDARVMKIQRRIHDPTECTCTFIVRFLHDHSEEGVSWNRLCCRPTTEEESVVYPILTLHSPQSPSPNFSLNPIESLWG
ncbi:hypothetical protein ACSQ67_021695 [Phaseolus vulgaris]